MVGEDSTNNSNRYCLLPSPSARLEPNSIMPRFLKTISQFFKISQLVFAVSCLLNCSQSANAQPSGTEWQSWKSGWSFSGGALYFDAGGPLPNRNLLTRGNLVPVLNSNAIDAGYGLGWELTAGKQLNKFWSLDARYSQVDSFNQLLSESNLVNGAGVRYFNTVSGVLGAVTGSYDLGYQSQFESTDVMLGRQLTDWWRLSTGVRHVRFDDNADIQIRGGGFSSLTNLNATNYLTGAQLGNELRLLQSSKFQLIANGLVGLYHNESNTRMSLRTVTTRVSTFSGTRTSCIGETNLKGRYKLLENLFVEGGYRVIWIEGIALATEQPILNRAPGTGPMTAIDNRDHRTLQGATANLTLLF